jgi:hypothetical protein
MAQLDALATTEILPPLQALRLPDEIREFIAGFRRTLELFGLDHRTVGEICSALECEFAIIYARRLCCIDPSQRPHPLTEEFFSHP